MELTEQEFLKICKTKIEVKYHLKNGDRRLKQRDFEYLIDLIEETSGTKLSISTLKRLWRETARQNPHPATLDALVSILDIKTGLILKLIMRHGKNLLKRSTLSLISHTVPGILR